MPCRNNLFGVFLTKTCNLSLHIGHQAETAFIICPNTFIAIEYYLLNFKITAPDGSTGIGAGCIRTRVRSIIIRVHPR